MKFIATGDWAIECILVNDQTVINSDGMRALEVRDREWLIQPGGQRFVVCQISADRAVLESNGETYYADYHVDASKLKLRLSRQNVKETVTFDAYAVTADVFSSN